LSVPGREFGQQRAQHLAVVDEGELAVQAADELT
jgi:hypothetical protein